ncbi:MAG: FtsW/RodA/SpoVE family cell cycle protein, partial [Chloroflexota bacterium]|nr:FtsW/RodA/SpoVE family cell cycle protein [Chloroflexota bacterium]
RLLLLAALFLGFYALALTLSPVVSARSWDVDFRWEHWAGYTVWVVGFFVTHRQSSRLLPKRDPFLLPIISMLIGWGLLTIWRLSTYFGLRQTIWLGIVMGVLIWGLRLPSPLKTLRRYKYIWLTGGLIITALTLIFGTNPMGTGVRLWLGCCGVYFQPSEPLKLLLIVYLSSYLADWQLSLNTPRSRQISPNGNKPHTRIHILTPTLIMTGLALLLLLVQRDLGTGSIFIFIYSVMIYTATGWRLIPIFSVVGLGLSAAAGYSLFDVVRLRVDAWLNPWLDPSGRSYQIVQSLIAVANGGIFGRGPGLGHPSLVPVAHSDFVFAAISEETGLVGALGLLLLIGLLAQRGLRIALNAKDPFQSYLAAGLTTHIVAQSILIIGGNLRLLPLTGVTLPFVSYGGSSLLTSFVALLLLLHISDTSAPRATHTASPTLVIQISALLLTAIAAAAIVTGWWGFYRGPDLLTRTDNPRRAIADNHVPRGALLDRYNTPIVETIGEPGSYTRRVTIPELGPLLGYNHPVYGQAGLEASLDPYLRGLSGQDALTIWWHHLIYGQPPPGLDVRLTLDLELQKTADDLLGDHTGALILLNAESGEILAMASHPTYDPNQIDNVWNGLMQDPHSPLLNRAMQGQYSSEDLLRILFPDGFSTSQLKPVPVRLPGGESAVSETVSSPMGVALIAAALEHQGIVPTAHIVQAYHHPENGWILLPPAGESTKITIPAKTSPWSLTMTPANEKLTWHLSGANSLALVIALEEENSPLAEEIGQAMLAAA